jgi:hypothetical protein
MLRISDLLASDVVGADGRHVGHVHEVRIVQDGPVHLGIAAAMRVDAILVGRGTIGGRLGYYHGQVAGPWVLRVLFRRASRHVMTIPMTAVAEWDDERRVVTLRAAATAGRPSSAG